MQLPKLKSNKKHTKQYIDQNPIEALTSVGEGIVGSLKKDVAQDSVYAAWDQFLGVERPHEHSGGDLEAGEEISLESLKGKEQKPEIEPGIEYAREIVQAGKHLVSENSREIQVKVQEILIEIKQLAKSSQELEKQVEVVSIEQMVEVPGKYHLNFLESVLQWINDARMNVEDSLAWFHALRSKKAARQYGVLSKKHGTSFSLSNERVVATQTG